MSIESHTEFNMNIQGLMSPVTINNHIDLYNYNSVNDIEAPAMPIE